MEFLTALCLEIMSWGTCRVSGHHARALRMNELSCMCMMSGRLWRGVLRARIVFLVTSILYNYTTLPVGKKVFASGMKIHTRARSPKRHKFVADCCCMRAQ